MRKFIENKYYGKSKIQKVLGDNYISFVRARIVFEKETVACFHYVGLLISESEFVYILPKFYRLYTEDDISDDELLLIQESLNYYGAKTSQITSSIYSEDGVICSTKIHSAIQIVQFYFERGLFGHKSEIETSSYEDKVNWEKTIDSVVPILQNGIPIYVAPKSVKNSSSTSHLISEIQKWVTNLSFDLIGKALYPHQNIDLISECNEEGVYHYIQIIESYLHNVYFDDEILLLQNILYFLKESANMESTDIEFFGTKVFYSIWEDSCKKLFKDQSDKIRPHIPFPIWKHRNEMFSSNYTLIPDILVERENYFYVIDAKYYLPKFVGGKPQGQPEISSLTKQFVYEQVLKVIYPDFKFFNFFCFPDENRILEDNLILELHEGLILGSVNFEISPFNEIQNIFLPPTAVLRNYIGIAKDLQIRLN